MKAKHRHLEMKAKCVFLITKLNFANGADDDDDDRQRFNRFYSQESRIANNLFTSQIELLKFQLELSVDSPC